MLKHNESLRRGIAVLRALAGGPQSLGALHRATGLAKSTLRRLLATLAAEGLVHRSLADDLYRTHAALGIAPAAFTGEVETRLAAVAAPILERLTIDGGWPCDLLVRRATSLVVAETNRARAPLLVNRNAIGDQVAFVPSAVGRAYLAFCPEAERAELLQALREAGMGPSHWGMTDPAFDRELAATRERGYGVRHARYAGATSREPSLIDPLSAIAVPLRAEDRVLGCINHLWPKGAMSVAAFAARYAARLQNTAQQIEEAWLRPTPGA
jgi:IclR family mhp operon transcriptional activator